MPETLFILAQASVWWETIPAQIVLWSAALAAVVAIARRMWTGSEFIRQLILHAASLGVTSQWPNGSTDLPSSLNEIYRRQGETVEAIKELREDFRAHSLDHEIHRIRGG